jgi:hypothetical protein
MALTIDKNTYFIPVKDVDGNDVKWVCAIDLNEGFIVRLCDFNEDGSLKSLKVERVYGTFTLA